MGRGLIQRFIWSYVAFCAAWKQYPDTTTVVPNKDLIPLLKALKIIPEDYPIEEIKSFS